MKTGLKIFIEVVVIAVICAWTIRQKKKIEKAEWLIGTWESKTSKGSIYETWCRANKNELSGKSYILRGKDTIVFENIQLIQENYSLFYIPTVENQNDGLPVRFATKTITETQLVFENAQHDFPQIISYTKINTDSLLAEISGTKNGKKRKQMFAMKRLK